MSLNTQKTFSSSDIIKNSLKDDKWFWIKQKQGNRYIQNHLLLIYDLAQKHPNSGALKKGVMKFYNRLSGKEIQLADFKVLISIITAIMIKNPNVYMICTAILSVLWTATTLLDKYGLFLDCHHSPRQIWSMNILTSFLNTKIAIPP